MNLASLNFFRHLTPELSTFLIAMIPIGELRASLPIALTVYDLPLTKAFFWSVFGNIIPGILLLWLLPPLTKFLENHFSPLHRFFHWLFERTRRKHSQKFEYWGAVALISFVAIPLPMTGVWTGAVAAFVFGVPFKKAAFYISLGALIAGIIVSIVSLGILKI
ncbi:small multi-drug export protein [Candidatus Shapirobacteria bacterium]|nr:small multi-drug export protein [Candidatus Shapirobacteria bacterium]